MSGRILCLSGAVFSVQRLLSYDADDDPVGKRKGNEQKDNALTLKQSLAFENVGFQYGPGLPFVIEDVSASISSGTYVALFGMSGSGKSALLGLVEGFHSCSRGRICMDGRDISSVSKHVLRNSLGVVFQNTYVLDGTIRENITFGLESSTMEDVTKATKRKSIHS
ncbi:hypothetical protein ACHAWF_005854 [Thalassiosira exigua]